MFATQQLFQYLTENRRQPDPKVVEKLLDQGAYIEFKFEHKTAIDILSSDVFKYSEPETVELLMRRGCVATTDDGLHVYHALLSKHAHTEKPKPDLTTREFLFSIRNVHDTRESRIKDQAKRFHEKYGGDATTNPEEYVKNCLLKEFLEQSSPPLRNHPKVIHDFVDNENYDISQTDGLSEAIKQSNKVLVQEFLEKGAKVEIQHLFQACSFWYHNSIEIFQLLVQHFDHLEDFAKFKGPFLPTYLKAFNKQEALAIWQNKFPEETLSEVVEEETLPEVVEQVPKVVEMEKETQSRRKGWGLVVNEQ